jgi:IclR family KDG regulon transcriptional repressor
MESTVKPAIQSVSRAVSILRCFTDYQELGLSEISKMTGLHKSTTSGIIQTLKAENFLVQNEETGKYRLSIDLFCLAIKTKQELGEVCEPYLESLLQQTGETVNLAVRDKSSVIYIEKKESPHSMRICTSVGKRMPLYCTAIGKAILAFLSDDETERLLNSMHFEAQTKNTIADRDKLLHELKDIRKEGVAYDFEELEYGLVCVAAPIFNRHHIPIGAVSVSGPSMRMDKTIRDKVSKEVQETAGSICKEISRMAF